VLLGTLWGQHVRNLGTHCFESISPLPTLQNRERGKKKKKKKKGVHGMLTVQVESEE